MITPQTAVPLARYRVLRTADEIEAAHEGGRAMSAHNIRPQVGAAFSWALHKVDIGQSTLLYHATRHSAELVATAPVAYFSLHLLIEGKAEIATDHGEVRLAQSGAAGVVSPTHRLRMRFAPDTRQLHVKIPVAVMEQTFGRLAGTGGGGNIVFDLAASTTTWPSALQFVVRTVDACGSGVVPPPRLASELERTLVGSLLLAQSHSARDLLLRQPADRVTRAVDEVAELIGSAPQQCIDVACLARNHGISRRSLYDRFRQRYGKPLSRVLRDARLDLAYRVLSQDPARTVTEVALDSGFTHLGRFARDYRLRFGETPSATHNETRSRSR